MRGKRLPLSVPRRIVTDVMRFAAKIPSLPVERMMNLSAVVAARAACPTRPPWACIFTKAFGMAAQEFPELRRAFLKWPWPHLYEYPASIAGITVERSYRGEPCVLLRLIKTPHARTVIEMAEIIHGAVDAPLDDVKDFKRQLTFARLPGIVRRPLAWLGYNIARQRANYFGTFVVTAVSFKGADFIHVPVFTTTLLTFGVIQPDGRVPVRVSMDHRVFDGMAIANILARLEVILNGPVTEELRAQAGHSETSKAAVTRSQAYGEHS